MMSGLIVLTIVWGVTLFAFAFATGRSVGYIAGLKYAERMLRARRAELDGWQP